MTKSGWVHLIVLMQSLMGETPKTALPPQDRAASLLLFDTVVRYGQQPNAGYRKNEGKPFGGALRGYWLRS
ncbi:MAG: hypothetical protein F6K10_39685 [Moorea sp. SIO2B7]|nr:hypothetical protein [Moorena sp. SIO2B7]